MASSSIDDANRLTPSWRLMVWGLRLEVVGLAVMLLGLAIDVFYSRSVGIPTKVLGSICVGVGIVIILVGAVGLYKHKDVGSPDREFGWALIADAFHPSERSP